LKNLPKGLIEDKRLK